MYNPDIECEKLANYIAQICNAKSLSGNAIALKADISSSTVSDLMNNKSNPQLYTLYKICNALDISILDMFSGIEDMEIIKSQGDMDEKREACIRMIQILPEWKMELLNEYVMMLMQYKK